jgi:uncharacterized protein (DUF1697 family)
MRYIALLRAINVGGHIVKMDRLRALFEALRLQHVETFIASGNVIFETRASDERALAGRIETHLEQSLGYAVATFLRTPGELAAVAAAEPFAPDELEDPRARLHVGLLTSRPSRAAQHKLLALRSETDDLHVDGRELYWLIRTSFKESPLSGGALEKALGMPTTLRNINTIRRLVARYPADS